MPARGILTQVGRARQELEEQRNGDSGHFVLGLPPSLGRSITVPLVKAFAEVLPHVRLATVEGLSVYIIEWLNVGRVDCALVYNAAPSPSVELQPLLDDQLFLITPLEEKNTRRVRKTITMAELSQYPLIIPSRPHAVRMTVENALAAVEQKIRVVHEIESIPAIIDLVRQRHGFAVLPLNAVKSSRWADAVQVKAILSPTLKSPLSIATSAQRPKSSLLRKASELIRDVVRQQIQPEIQP
jgi:LysR family nitrogen assimilation transcriptional regulator